MIYMVMKNKVEKIVFGGGCFWCIEAVFQLFKGVLKTTPGYAGGRTKNPIYEDVCSGETGHAEVLKIEYDPTTIDFDTLLDVFFTMHDPTTLNAQGADVGSQYRSIILYSSELQKKKAEEFVKKTQENFDEPIVTEIKKLTEFYAAEDYHKNYYTKNPLQPYCMLAIGPKVEKIKRKYDLK